MVEVAKPTANRLDQNSPNPFNATTRISYSIKQPGQVVLAIYNLQGQRVRTLVAKPHETGSYSAIWDGRDDAGHDLPTGAYLYLLKMPDAELSQRMTLIK
ncbi:MAG: flagellar basal body rod modification protein [bacterium ADurb.Bin431]|nr:MAG: flagellar basal body rod modification protein [bacterium ADurb.Bin431]